jgi:hypothetical protein
MSEGVIIAIVSAIGASSASLFGFFRWLLPWWLSKKRGNVADGLRRISNVYHTMHSLLEIGSDRIILWAAHNSGGVPRVGSPLYASSLHWVVRKGYKDRLQNYQQVPVDPFYVSMLLKMHRDSFYHFQPEGEPECMLKDYYMLEGVTDSYLFFLGIRENQFLYVSIAKYGGKFTAKDFTTMRIKVQSIINNLGSDP